MPTLRDSIATIPQVLRKPGAFERVIEWTRKWERRYSDKKAEAGEFEARREAFARRSAARGEPGPNAEAVPIGTNFGGQATITTIPCDLPFELRSAARPDATLPLPFSNRKGRQAPAIDRFEAAAIVAAVWNANAAVVQKAKPCPEFKDTSELYAYFKREGHIGADFDELERRAAMLSDEDALSLAEAVDLLRSELHKSTSSAEGTMDNYVLAREKVPGIDDGDDRANVHWGCVWKCDDPEVASAVCAALAGKYPLQSRGRPEFKVESSRVLPIETAIQYDSEHDALRKWGGFTHGDTQRSRRRLYSSDAEQFEKHARSRLGISVRAECVNTRDAAPDYDTPIAELVSFCEKAIPSLDSVGFDPTISIDDRFARVDEFAATLRARIDSTIAAYANRHDSAEIYRLVRGVGEGMSRLLFVARMPYVSGEENRSDAKSSRWVEALLPVNSALRELGILRSVAPTDADARGRYDSNTTSLAAVCRGAVGAEPEPPASMSKLSPSRLKARAVYEWAIERIAGADRLSIDELHSEIRCELRRQIDAADDDEAEKLEQLLNDLPTRPDTFAKYIRDAGIKRYNKNGARNVRYSRRPGTSQ